MRQIFLLTLLLSSFAFAAPLQMQVLNGAPRVWSRSDFAVSGVPEAKNPFDPDEITVDATFTAPDGKSVTLPAFWFQDYARELKNGKELLTPVGNPGWRVRWAPLTTGAHRWKLIVVQGGQTLSGEGTISVGAKPENARGFARVEPKEKRYFQTDDGAPLPLSGENVCWFHERGTFDYDDWFAGYSSAAMNYTRLWMHSDLGIEFFSNERTNYNQQRAWKLDYILNLANQSGIYAMLCLDYHGVFQDKPDMWGGNDWWPKHPYNQTTGGPCATQNDWFTNAEAEKLYRKRLRYLIGRYSSFPSLFSWQFFNEINNVYDKLKPADVAAWHDRQAQWLKAHDPYKHLVTTSFGSDGDQPEMWKLPSLDYANYHWYANWGGKYTSVLQMTNGVAQDFRARYGKPVVIAEFGTDGRGGTQNRAADPFKRGLVQAIWGGIFSGTAGSVSPWWWEQNHAENNYELWGVLNQFLDGTNFGSAAWKPLEASGPKMSEELGDAIPGAAPFDIQINTSGGWGGKPKGIFAVHSPADAGTASLNPYIHGNSKKDLIASFVLQAHLAANAKLTIHVNSVSNDAILAVKANGKEIFRRALPNKDGKYETNHEYDEDIEVPLPAGDANGNANAQTDIEIFNPGGDWIYVDWVKLSGALPSRAPQPNGVPLDAWAQSDGKMALVYCVDPRFNWPRGSAAPSEKLSSAVATLRGLPDGNYSVQWFSTRQIEPLNVTKTQSQNGTVKLVVPPFETDIAAKIYKP